MNMGLVQIYFGNGKGKTTAACGICCRALAYGYKVIFARFLKPNKSGEILFLYGDRNIQFFNTKYSHPLFDKNVDIAGLKSNIKEVFEKATSCASSHTGEFCIVIFDELLNCINEKFISEKEVIDFIKTKPKNLEVIITGRKITGNLKKIADLVTEFKEVKHPFRKGIMARKGIEH